MKECIGSISSPRTLSQFSVNHHFISVFDTFPISQPLTLNHIFNFQLVNSFLPSSPNYPLSPENSSWPWDGIAVNRLINIDQDPRIRGFIRARKRNSTRARGPTARNDQLIARHIELRAPCASRRMQRDDLGSQQIVARCKTRRHGESTFPTVVVERHGTPFLRREVVALLVDLEPDRAAAIGGRGVADPRKVDDDGPVMVAANCLLGAGALAGLGVHFDCQGLAGWNVLSLPCLLLGMGEMQCIPATVQSPGTPFEPPTLQRMSFELTLVTGLLLGGVRIHVPPLSTPLTHSCWKVEWAVTDANRAAKGMNDFIFTATRNQIGRL